MYFCIAGLCAGTALAVAFPGDTALGFVGPLLFAVSALTLLVLLIVSVVRSVRSRNLQGPQLLAGVLLLVIALFVFQRLNAPSSETRIERTIGKVSTGADPAYCDELMTERYLEQTTGEEAPFADEACESEAGNGAADSVEVREVAVDGDRATATVTNSGGSLDGSVVVVQLLERGGQWKLDRIVRFDRFDRARFRGAYRRKLHELGFSARAANCILGRERRVPAGEIEREVLDPGDRIFAAIVVGCDRAQVEANLMSAVADPALGLPKHAIGCAKRRLATASNAELMRVQLKIPAYNELLLACDRDAFLAFHRRGLSRRGDLGPAAVECVVEHLMGLSDRELIDLTYDEDRYEARIARCESSA